MSLYGGNWEQHQHKWNLDQLRIQYKYTVMDEMNVNVCSFFFTLQGPSTLHSPPDWETHHSWSLGVGEVWWMAVAGHAKWKYNPTLGAVYKFFTLLLWDFYLSLYSCVKDSHLVRTHTVFHAPSYLNTLPEGPFCALCRIYFGSWWWNL